jgi:hypothetical protein
MTLDQNELEAIAAALFEKLAPLMPDALARPRALMSCAQAGADLGISGEKVRVLVEAGLIERVPGFTDTKISPEALAKYRATAA